MFLTSRKKQEIHNLELEIESLNRTVMRLELEEKIKEEDIKHMVKMSEERREVELEKERIQMEGEKAAAIAEVKDAYQDKVEAGLKTQLDNMQQLQDKILSRLPNITAHWESGSSRD